MSSYNRDHRVQSRERWYESIDQKRMTATVRYDDENDCEVVKEVPIKFEVCPTCDGKGTHVDPAIDSHGLSADDFSEDPDFAESYVRGDYDVTCFGCGGRRVVPICMDEKVQQALDKTAEAMAAFDAEVAAEQRMSA